MITQLPLIVSSLLITISYAAAPFQYAIDMDRCKTEMTCFVRKSSCIDVPVDTSSMTDVNKRKEEAKVEASKKKLVVFKGTSNEIRPTCDVFVQIKSMSEKKYLVIMEVTSTTDFTGPDHDKGISIMHGPGPQMACKKGSEEPTLNDNLKSTHYSTEFQSNKMFCAFILTPKDDKNGIIESYFEDSTFSSAKPSFVFSLNEVDATLEYSKTGNDFWKAKVECDQKDMTTSDVSFEEYLVKEADTSTVEITCEGKNLVVMYDGKEEEIDKLVCLNDNWSWNGISADEEKPLAIGCLDKKYCASCADLPAAPGCAEGECTAATKVNAEGSDCMMRKCDGGKWTKDGKEIIETSNENDKPQVTCEKGPSGGDSKWFIHVKGVGPKPIDAASCLSVVDCPSNFKCPEGKTCPVVSTDKTTISCSKGQLKNNGTTVSEVVKCNRESGTWSNVDIKKDLYCEEEGSNADASPNTGGGGSQKGLFIGIGVAVIIGVGIAVVVIWKVILPKRKKDKGGAGKGGTTSRKAGQKSSKKSSEKSKSKSGSGGKKSEGSDPPENKADGAKSTGESTPATPSTPAAVEGEKKGPPTTDIEGIKTDPAAPSDPKVPPTPGAPTPGAPTPGVPPPVPPPAGAVPV